MSTISRKVEAKIEQALLNDGKIDAQEALAIAKATPAKERAAVAQALMDDGFSGSSDDLKKVAAKLGRTDMPVSDFKVTLQKTQDGLALEHVQVDGVTFKMAVGKGEYVSPEKLKAIAKAINDNNKLIADPKLQVHEVAIAQGATTRMSTYQGKPLLVMDPKLADGATASHESGHQVFFSLRQVKDTATLCRVADIYNKLMATQQVEGTIHHTDGTTEKQTGPSGMWPFDPPQWKKGASSEHATDDPDEFFGSAMEAYRTDRAGLEKAIDAWAKKDPAGAQPAKDMLALLDELAAGKGVTPAKLSKDERVAADAQLKRIKDPGQVEDTLDTGISVGLADTLRAKN